MKNTILSSLLLLAAAAQLPAANFTFSPSSGTVSGTFTVDVLATDLWAGRNPATDGIISYGFNVSLSNPSILSFVGAQSGVLFDAATTQPGTDVFGAASGLGIFDPVAEPLLLATLTFKVLSEGAVDISITSDTAGNLFHGLQYLDAPNQEGINARLSFTAVPEPSTFALAGLALAGLAAARRRWL